MKFTFKDFATTTVEIDNVKNCRGFKPKVLQLQIKKNEKNKSETIQLFYKTPEMALEDLNEINKNLD